MWRYDSPRTSISNECKSNANLKVSEIEEEKKKEEQRLQEKLHKKEDEAACTVVHV